jgi:RES domain-containing protein
MSAPETLTVWRLCSRKFAVSAFSGEGARLYGGRWSPPGIAAVYCSESRALAALEVLAHIEDTADFAAIPWVARSIELPVAEIEKPSRVPASWRQFPYIAATQRFGDDWLRTARAVALRLPSAIIPGEFNYLLNPAHPSFPKLRIGKPSPFRFDPRLKGK